MKFTFFRAFLVILTYISFLNQSLAFDSEGHRRIEQRAYELLINDPSVNGKQILESLRFHNILKQDLVVRPHSAFPDIDAVRQFDEHKQMYHFMASNRIVNEAAKITSPSDKQYKVLIETLPECLKVMYCLYREILQNPTGASQSGRGLYVLIHLIADSYSIEHTKRSISGKIITIKGWQFSDLKSKFDNRLLQEDPSHTYWDKKGHPLLLLHRKDKPNGDDEWVDITGSLSDNSETAALAIEKLLLTIYNSTIDISKIEDNWETYISEFFYPDAFEIKNHQFINSTQNDTINYLYPIDYSDSTHAWIYTYDGSNRIIIQIFPQINNKGNFIGGIEGIFMITPYRADEENVLIARLPLGVAVSLTENFNLLKSRSKINSIQLKANFITDIATPFGIIWQPRVGYGFYPFGYSEIFRVRKENGLVLGSDLWRNFGTRLRMSFGYDYTWANELSAHNFSLKFGFNTIQARIPF